MHLQVMRMRKVESPVGVEDSVETSHLTGSLTTDN